MRFNKKNLNYSAWIVILLTYILPSHNFGEFATDFGYPISYLTIYDTTLSKTLLSSFNVNISTLAMDILIIYLIILYGQKVILKTRINKKVDK